MNERDVSKTSYTSNYTIIQRPNPSYEQQVELEELGTVFHMSMEKDTSLCSYKAKNLKPILDLPWVTYAGPYPTLFKVHPRLQPRDGSSSRKVDVVIIFHDDVDAQSDTVIAAVAKQARLDPKTLKADGGFLAVRIQEKYLSDLATVDQVRNVEEDYVNRVFNNVVRNMLKADVVQQGSDGKGYSGQGQVIAVADSGFE